MPNESTAREPTTFLIVSGLPRSGTSLMMQMLEAGGLPVMRDDLRPPDESNPRGYFEWQAIKQLPKNPCVIAQTQGRVTKVISMLLPSLRRDHRFRVIFMRRVLLAVAASQEKMRARVHGGAGRDVEQLAARLGEHRDRILHFLRASENVELLEVEYDELVAQPGLMLPRVAHFCEIPSEKHEAMAAVIDPALRHFAADGERESAHRSLRPASS